MSEPLRILQVVPYFYPSWAYGGIPRLAYGLARQQACDGHQVSVVTTDALDARSRTPRSRRHEVMGGVQIWRFPNASNQLAYEQQLFLPLGLRGWLEERMAEFDIVHLHGHRHLLNNLAVRSAQRHGRPVVMTANGTVMRIERKQRVKALWDLVLGAPVLESVDHFIAVSQAEVSQYLKMGIAAPRISVIYNGLDLAEFESLPARGALRARLGLGQRPVILYLGKLTPRKGVDVLIRALPRLRSDAHLVIVGNDMGVQEQLERLVAELRLGARVHFTGLLTGEERLSALRDADLLIYPSTQEIFGLVPFEGLLCGTPVVVSDDCGCGELVNKAGAGLLVPYADHEALAGRMAELLDDPERGRRMAARGRRFIERHFAWSVVARQTDEVYRRVLSGVTGSA